MSLGNLSVPICAQYDGRNGFLPNKIFRQLAADTNGIFHERFPMIRVREIMHTVANHFVVILSNDSKGELLILPGKIAQCPAMHILEKEIPRPAWTERKAKRVIEPNTDLGVIDDTAYDTLRPGVLIRSRVNTGHVHPAQYLTNSGVMVKNSAGDVFMTGASHGIGEDERVFETLSTGENRDIGKAVHELSFTDIVIVKLENNTNFNNELFEDTLGVKPPINRLFGELETDQMVGIPAVYLNPPFSGNIDGIVVACSITLPALPPVSRTEQELKYVMYSWSWMGQVGGRQVELSDGVCGTPILEANGIVLGLFHFYITTGGWAGFAASVSADELVRAGYILNF
ncbi:hypothetical protein S40285_06402 [Stachybotrys chlorohalonatus IBT 40285]|uniref:Uncharacterized protein n=1 Tax=Stachybotrys chlorohalonatus (strain IBT 40285) TaxID=1283841 RepID=A0A084QGG8_STAC4|nr:hypothetical protein S40285_06402 [Stachybotrys chlorohalonata IBT 40285]